MVFQGGQAILMWAALACAVTAVWSYWKTPVSEGVRDTKSDWFFWSWFGWIFAVVGVIALLATSRITGDYTEGIEDFEREYPGIEVIEYNQGSSPDQVRFNYEAQYCEGISSWQDQLDTHVIIDVECSDNPPNEDPERPPGEFDPDSDLQGEH